ncbi:NUDIX domain-containing protein [Brumimicrobium glaciale]|uniref:NUDIX domain-containing protein n=1 Tax=Brumimicrobium glaciale TaxID=200475 RepID=A0A4Q4KEU7_9FLAO|nr:NUDIX domain-containing protein [Brumimicrobium glaciale]RYM31475.1 NUDIX domain-containing protein [Brumimicrobium glaciale]
MAFNIRVYGILINSNHEVLLSDERRFGKEFTKFPGGGLELGEGIKDCLIREFQEELDLEIEVKELIYLTDFYQKSAFHKDDQIISVYYDVSAEKDKIDLIKTKEIPFDFEEDAIESHRWKGLKELNEEDVTFPIDKLVIGLLEN